MKEEIQILKGEFLLWVNRWKELNLKNDKYKVVKGSLVVANDQLLKQGEQKKFKIIKLWAKLSEARRVSKLHITTLNGFVSVYICQVLILNR